MQRATARCLEHVCWQAAPPAVACGPCAFWKRTTASVADFPVAITGFAASSCVLALCAGWTCRNALLARRMKQHAAALCLRKSLNRRLGRAAAPKEAHAFPFEVSPVPDTGLGAVASRDIECGELVLAERPIFAFSNGDTRQSLHRRFAALPQEQQEALMSLCDSDSDGNPEGKTLEGIIRTNCFFCEGKHIDVAFGLNTSRFNHSCVPNCEQSWHEGSGQQRIYATTSVRAGDELCVYYVDVIAPRCERAEEMRQSHGLLCQCRACRNPCADSDERRSRMQQLDQDINDLGEADPASGERMSVASLHKRSRTGLKLVLQLLDLYDQEGIHLQSLRRQACLYAMQFCAALEDEHGQREWFHKACMYSTMCQGEDHEETIRLLQMGRRLGLHSKGTKPSSVREGRQHRRHEQPSRRGRVNTKRVPKNRENV